jgi:hypothetical protein
VNDNDPLAKSIADWQHKHRIADDDPVLAVLGLVRLQIQHAHASRDDADAAPPSFEDFRGTIELLDRRSKAFIQQATDLIAELRRFGLNVQRINRARLITQLLLIALGGAIGGLLTRIL